MLTQQELRESQRMGGVGSGPWYGGPAAKWACHRAGGSLVKERSKCQQPPSPPGGGSSERERVLDWGPPGSLLKHLLL